ncbi:MAG TPA: NAD-glutamate dehydrogenase domain-containing protein, partial [Phycisphaerales bacterium]|nr:NAD-glutamate dehydrogenase domain-containing protein [Phycisphaerales bacterium]
PTKPAQPGPAILDEQTLMDELIDGFRATASTVVPWFLKNLPPMYFQDTDHTTQLVHLQAIIAAKSSGRPLHFTLKGNDQSQWTSMRPLDYPGVLAEIVAELPHDRPLRAAKIHTALDGQLVLDTFEFGEGLPFNPDDPEQALKLEQTMGYAALNLPQWSPNTVREFFQRCRADYVLTLTPLRMCSHWQLFRQVTASDGTAVTIEPEADPRKSRIVVAASNASTRLMLERVATRLSRSGINIHRAYLDTINDQPHGSVSLLGFVVEGPTGEALNETSPLWKRVRKDLLRIKWFDDRTLNLAYRNNGLSLVRAEVITGLCQLVHQVLCKINPYAYNPDRIFRIAEKNLPQSLKIVELLMDRFDPQTRLDDAEFERRAADIVKDINRSVDLEDARVVLRKFVDAVRAVLRTNVFLENRSGLAFRLEPSFLKTDERPELPFGVFFVHGRCFNGFHVRFRDIARGGIRAVRPIGADQYARELERLYDEAYGLAFAQQLKNKDIPEGGSKAAILIEPATPIDRGVKAFVDSVLDLITPDAEIRKLIVDRFGRDELLYFGPDENITPQLIDWVVDRAKRRGYPTPTALMSSKPGAGINHKQYGVTSEGLNVFLEVALKTIGIDPRKHPFTVKITGGPDGDVAGNMIRILDRDYGPNARIVGISDGSGCAEDPDGLDHNELLRLFNAALPISHFERSMVSRRGRLVALDDPNGVHLRNSLHNRVVADAFVPAGGRPAAMHIANWHEYLQPDGTPSSRVIVEGANLFLTPEARVELSRKGVLIFKDSSANKCGVICSSFEIIASMLLNEQEFLGIKEAFVAEVLVRLRELARREAELLARVHVQRPDIPLPEISTQISRVMIRIADAIEQSVDALEQKSPALMRQLVMDHLPPVLLKTVGDRLWSRTPRPYLKWIMAKTLAARLVYREGYESLEEIPSSAIPELAIGFLREETERKRLVQAVAQSSLPEKTRIADLLAQTGILSSVR